MARGRLTLTYGRFDFDGLYRQTASPELQGRINDIEWCEISDNAMSCIVILKTGDRVASAAVAPSSAEVSAKDLALWSLISALHKVDTVEL